MAYKNKDRKSFFSRFNDIQRRCLDERRVAYKDYGARGIKCTWPDFQSFSKDMYCSFLEHVKTHGLEDTFIERIDNDGDYSKENCEWATRKEQNQNSRHNRIIAFNGQSKRISEWAKEIDCDYRKIADRLDKLGWTIERALTLLTDGRAGRMIPSRKKSAKKLLGKKP